MLKRAVFFAGLSLVFVLVSCDQTVDIDARAQSVEVAYDERTVEIDLGTLTTSDVEGVDMDMVRLSAVVEAADLGVGLEFLMFDFLSADGFQPRSSPNCTDEIIPLPGSYLEQGYIDPMTRDLYWDEALNLPGCVGVDDTAQILVTDLPLPER